jgi:trehalose 6-phosphate synthase
MMLEAYGAEHKERTRRMRAMRRTVSENDVAHWASTFLDELAGKRLPHTKSTRPAKKA